MTLQQFALFEPTIKEPSKNGQSQPFELMTSHASPEWYTPPEIVGLVRQVLGVIDLDPASSDQAQETVKAAKYYTIESNGLRWPWYGRVFLNPPYGKNSKNQSNQAVWSSYLVHQYEKGNVTEGILLVEAKIGYGWFSRLLKCAPAFCFPWELISFIPADGRETSSAKVGSCFFYFGSRVERFREIFSPIGLMYPV